MSDIDISNLLQRLAAAERVCYLVGITAGRQDTDRDKAKTQAWMEWSHQYRHLVRPVSDEEIVELAARRDVIRHNTLIRIREREEEREKQRCRLDILEYLYEQQTRDEDKP